MKDPEVVSQELSTRQQIMDFLEGYTQERKGELDTRQLTRGLVKSYLLETVPNSSPEPDIESVFRKAGIRLDRVDEALYKVWDTDQELWGFLENLISRHPVLYTTIKAKDSDQWVSRIVNTSPELDRVWISGRAFEMLWRKVLHINPGARYGKLAFSFDNIFEVNGDGFQSDDEELGMDEEKAPDAPLVSERKAARFTLVDRLNEIEQKLPRLQEVYHPLHSICQLRFPAAGRGGHDFYHDGKVTNRSDSFADHRAHLLYVLRMYKAATEDAERKAWYSIRKTTFRTGSELITLQGAPVVIKFAEALPVETLEKWVSSTFQSKRNRFRLWGRPIPVGPRKFHIYGADRHLWQPIFLEITDKHLLAILPEGTCANTVHRLVTNVQLFIDPRADVSVGDHSYDDIVANAFAEQVLRHER